MFNDIGKLDDQQITEIESIIKDFFDSFEDSSQLKDTTSEALYEICKTPNYFMRDFIGKTMAKYKNHPLINSLIDAMLADKIYGIRATALFFLYYSNIKNPVKILQYVEKFYQDNPWESETIMLDLWKRHTEVMKVEIPKWLDSDDENKRVLAINGIENLGTKETVFILNIIDRVIDDKGFEMQKKVSHILFILVKSKPEYTYPFIRNWLINSKETREKIIWNIMRKTVGFLTQKNGKDKTNDFIVLTRQVINDWKNDNHPKVNSMGKKLAGILKKYS